MKHYLICVFFVFSISLICAENFDKNGKIIDLEGLYYDTGITSDIIFSERKLTSRDYEKGSRDNNYVIHSSNVSLKSDSNISFILTDSGERYLILANPELMVLYKKNQKQPHVVGTNLKGMDELIDYVNPNLVSASSELKEHNYNYSAGNIANVNLTGLFLLKNHTCMKPIQD